MKRELLRENLSMFAFAAEDGALQLRACLRVSVCNGCFLRRGWFFGVLFGLFLFFCQAVSAATYTWTGDISDVWTNGSNWQGGLVPSGNLTSDTLIFSGGEIFVTENPNNLIFGSVQISGQEWIFDLLGNYTFNNSNFSVSSNVSNFSGTILTLSGSSAINVTTSGTLFNLDPTNITGAGGIEKNGDGILQIASSSANYTGATTINAGTLRITNVGAINTFSSDVSVLNSSVFTANFTGTGTFNRNVTGSGTFLKEGGGTLTLNGSSYSNIQNNGSTTLTFGSNATVSGGLSGTSTFTINSGRTVTFDSTSIVSANLAGSGGVIKAGSGTTTINGTASHTGGTTVNAGTLLVTGAISGGGVTVNSGGFLAGTGSIGGLTTLNNGATLTPGNGVGNVGTLTISSGGLSLSASSTVVMDINSSSSFDRTIVSSGGITYNGTLSLNFSYNPTSLTTYNLFDITVGSSGNFTSINLTGGGVSLSDVSFNPSTGNLTVIPEPGTMVLVGIGASFLLWRVRRRQRAQS